MAYQKLQTSLALNIVPSDTISIPAAGGVQQSGIAATPTGAQLVSTGTLFESSVRVGDIVYDSTNGVLATVLAIVSDTVLTTSAAIAVGASYTIFAEAESGGCSLYVGGLGDVKVKMAAGGDAIFSGVPAGSFMPVNVTKVYSTGTTATNIIGLW